LASKKYETRQSGPQPKRISAKVAARQMTSGFGSVGSSGGGSSQTGVSGSP
jgi:hypothetical protein